MRKFLTSFVLLFVTILTSNAQTSYIINTIAGNGVAGYSGDGGQATAAEINEPWGVVDAMGNVYFADQFNAVVRKINTSGVITTIAGNGTSGFSGDGGPATAAEIGFTFELTLDPSGNLYIADQVNNRVREVNTLGIINTVAGNGSFVYSGDGGPATAAGLPNGAGITIDLTGDILIGCNGRIRIVNTAGIISTFAGNGVVGYSGDGGQASAAEMNQVNALTIDGAGNIYLTDQFNGRIRKINAAGIINTIAGNGVIGYSGDGGPATAAEVQQPQGIAIDGEGNLFIADLYNQRIRVVGTNGIINTIAGNGAAGFSGDGGIATAARIAFPQGVAVDASGNVYISDNSNQRIRKLTPICPVTGNGVVILGPVNSSSLPPAYNTTLNTSGISTIGGVLTIDNNYTISGTTVAMAKDAQIVVETGKSLTIINAGFIISRLYACNEMWQGIVLEPGASLTITSSIVEDAVVAIEGKGAPFSSSISINSAFLNNNLFDIQLDPGYFNSSGGLHLTNTILTCAPDIVNPIYSPNPFLKAPYSGQITNSGIHINNPATPFVTIGDYSNSGLKNTFSNMNYGVNALDANINVYNNDFIDLKGRTSLCSACSLIGIAVLAVNDGANPTASYFANVGGTLPNQPNNMKDVYRGVDISFYPNVNVLFNTMSNGNNTGSIFHPSPYGDHGIFIKNNILSVNVNDNKITNFNTGIHMFGDISALNFVAGTANVEFNNCNTSGHGHMTTGILCEYPSVFAFVTPNYNIISNNVLNSTFSGITLNNGSNRGNLINNNYVQIFPSTRANDRSKRSGILVENSNGYFVTDNNTVAPGTNILTGYGSIADTNVIGIHTITGYGTYECNSMSEVGQCMRFEGPCSPSTVFNNSFISSTARHTTQTFDGLALWYGSYIGQQGASGQPSGNTWTGPTTFLNSQTWCQSTDGFFSTLYVNNTVTENPSNNGSDFNGTAYTPGYSLFTTSGPYSVTCPCASCMVSTAATTLQQTMRKVVKDSIPFSSFAFQNQYLGKQAVLLQLNSDSSLRSGDTALQNFYNNSSFTNLGTLFAIDSLIGDKQILSAQNKNNNLLPVNNLEQNHKDVNDIMINTISSNIYDLTSAQYNTLYSIAVQCPMEGGRAVFQARALLNRLLNTSIIFNDSCGGNNNNARIAQQKQPPVGLSTVKVYPNPANTIINVEASVPQGTVQYMSIYNSVGEKIRDVALTDNFNTISVEELPSGIYYYRITDNSAKLLKADKLVVSH